VGVLFGLSPKALWHSIVSDAFAPARLHSQKVLYRLIGDNGRALETDVCTDEALRRRGGLMKPSCPESRHCEETPFGSSLIHYVRRGPALGRSALP
jgi:hypothetical protein